ncbi:GNAT family N-acetyltransferase [Lysobacter sp. TY2-98]|nr:GNAT family N-acetyltransferase [Lysobacter sp. TY2-98]
MGDAARVSVREVRGSDAERIAMLSAQLGYPATAQAISERLAWLADLDGEVFVAELDDMLMGWIAVERRITLESGIAFEITGLVVDATRRRTGAGRALVDAAEAWSRDRGASALIVRSNIVREESHAFYAGIGFARSKTQHVYRRAIGAASDS